SGLAVLEEVGLSSQALAFASHATLDLAIVDVVVPETGGVALVRGLVALQPTCKVLALSVVDDPARIAEMLRAGASGYALKSQSSEAIVIAIEAVLGGVRYLAPTITADVVDALIAAANFPLDRLTRRERGVFDLLVSGLSNAKVGASLSIATSTVEAHRRHIMQKLEARSVVDLVRMALRHGTTGTT
ncbi:MAG: response regulator transcription factor, partial [Kofleriaceae bacterium]